MAKLDPENPEFLRGSAQLWRKYETVQDGQTRLLQPASAPGRNKPASARKHG